MHHKYAKDGLVCMSVSIDETDNKDRALAFLQKQRALFPNYLIDEPAEVWGKKLQVGSPPAVLVYGRDGQQVKKFAAEDGPFTYADVEKVVVPLLQEK